MTDLKRSFPPVTDARTRLLVLGSLPGERSLAQARYYAHPQNHFWSLIGSAIDRDLVSLDYPARLAALLQARVGLWDVVASAHRAGSSDAAIRDHDANDLAGLVAALPCLRAIGFNGSKANAIGARALASVATSIERVALPSSSPLHTIGLAAKLPAWLELRRFLQE